MGRRSTAPHWDRIRLRAGKDAIRLANERCAARGFHRDAWRYIPIVRDALVDAALSRLATMEMDTGTDQDRAWAAAAEYLGLNPDSVLRRLRDERRTVADIMSAKSVGTGCVNE